MHIGENKMSDKKKGNQEVNIKVNNYDLSEDIGMVEDVCG